MAQAVQAALQAGAGATSHVLLEADEAESVSASSLASPGFARVMSRYRRGNVDARATLGDYFYVAVSRYATRHLLVLSSCLWPRDRG